MRNTPEKNVELPRILVVDDEEQVARLIVRILRQEYACETAATVDEARHRLCENEFELALIDVNMPGESGLDLLAHLQRHHPKVAALMVTGIDDRQLAQSILENGAYGYIVKPFKPNEFQINVANTLRRHRLELERKTYQQRLEETVEFRTVELKEAIRRLQETQQELRTSREEMIQRLARAVEFRSEETGRHIERMSLYAGILAQRAGLEPVRCELIKTASAMHDIGKVGVPDRILNKPGKLTAEEFDVIKQHCEIGYRIFAGSTAELPMLAATIAQTHHEKWDGTGYPQGLSGQAIPLEARIAAIADVFDALTTKRVYKEAFAIDEALAVMRRDAGRHFDPELLQVFLEALEEILDVRERYSDSDDSDQQVTNGPREPVAGIAAKSHHQREVVGE